MCNDSINDRTFSTPYEQHNIMLQTNIIYNGLHNTMCQNKTIAQLNFRPIALKLTKLGSTLQHLKTICHFVSNQLS